MSSDLSTRRFRVERILNFEQNAKSISLLATSIADAKPAIILLEKLQFDESKFNSSLELTFSPNNSEVLNANDIYTHLFCRDSTAHFDTKVKIIYPATETHILKYTKPAIEIVTETPELYQKVTLPFILANSSTERLQWVYNILDHGQEAEKVLFKDDDPTTGYYLVPDTKWDCKNTSSLYYLAICKRRDIHSVRDFNASHLGLLKRMLHEIPQRIEAKFGLPGCKLRMFVHYQPSYYHFHLHVLNVENDDAAGAIVGKAILLQDIIDGIETFGTGYWQRRTISYSLSTNHALYSLLKGFKSQAETLDG